MRAHPIRKACVPAAVLALLILVTPGVAQAAKYRFKVDLTVVQNTDWEEAVRHPAPGDAYCGDRDVHYVYKSSGDGELRAKVRGARMTFTGTRRVLQSSEIKVPGTVVSDHTPWTIAMQGVPDEGCEVPPPPQPPTSEERCNPLIRQPGVARSFLLVMRGRLNLTGGFYRRDKRGCTDPSLYTGVLGFGGRPKRNDVNTLITNKRVRSIELSSSATDKFGLKDLSSFGANSETVEASGTGKARWTVKLTRLR